MAEEQDLPADEPAGADTSASESDDKRAVEEWAELLFPASAYGYQHKERWRHGAAGALHGWALHEQHANAPLRLSEADYRAAIEASTRLVDDRYVPHGPARSPYLAEAESADDTSGDKEQA